MPTTRTVVVAPSGGDYTSIGAAITAETTDLQTADRLLVIEFHSGDYTSFGGGVNYSAEVVTFPASGFNSDATRFVRLIVPTAHRHDGRLRDGSSVYTGATVSSNGANHIFTVSTPFTEIVGLASHQTGSGQRTAVLVQGANVLLDAVVARSDGQTTRETYRVTSTPVRLRNCLAVDANNRGFSFVSSDGVHAYNCTARNCGLIGFTGSSSGAAYVLRNCLATGHSSSDFSGNSTFDHAYCASGDGTADDLGGTGNRASQTFTFASPGGTEHGILDAADAGARDHGTDLSADATLPVTEDVLGTARPQNSVFDIGYHEVAAAGGGATILPQMMQAGLYASSTA